jgi:ABC-type branched-subunit amino acid transport system ATPase component
MLLDVKGLTKSFGGLVAVNNLDFYINRGEVLILRNLMSSAIFAIK